MKQSAKTRILILLIFLSPVVSYSQEYDALFFTLGFASDYMGRQIEKGIGAKESSVDGPFHESRLYNLLRLDTLLKTNKAGDIKIEYEIEKRDRQANCSGCGDFYDLNSKQLCKQVNLFYRFKKDQLNSNDSIQRYDGRLKTIKIMFSSRKKRISFLAGAFYRYGGIDTVGYYVKFSNSKEKTKTIRKLLKRFNSTITKEINNQERGLYISPNIQTIYFKPSAEIKALFDHEQEMKTKLKRKINCCS